MVNRDTIVGISTETAQQRLSREGPNRLPEREERKPLKVFLDALKEPMVALLLGCGGVYLVLGDQQEALMLIAFVVVIFSMTVYQELKTEKSLEALRDLSSPRALVIRDRKKQRIAGADVVRDDVVIISEGDKIPADGVVLFADHLGVDESLMTGEPFPAIKIPRDEDVGKGPASQVFAGTVVVHGNGLFQVTHTGSGSQLGKIGRLLADQKPVPTQLERETRQIVKQVAIYVLVLCLVVMTGMAWQQGSWLQGFLSAMTLAMAILPNELPAVLAIFMAMGAFSLSRKRILTRRTAAVEALGTINVLCVDKTGTLTHNQMTVTELYGKGQTLSLRALDPKGDEGLPEVFHELVEFGALATDPEPFDPMDKALNRVLATYLGDTEHVHPQWDLVKRYPLAPALLARSNVWRSSKGESQPGASGETHPVAAKGAPEAIFELCHLEAGQRPVYEKQVQGMAQRGLRVLGVAKALGVHEDPRKRFESVLSTDVADGAGGDGDPSLPSHQHDFDFEFVGLIGLEDPLRSEVPGAVDRCHRAGIRVIMITGDHPETAAAIGQQAGLTDPTAILTGAHMETMAPKDLRSLLGRLSICARMSPLQKRHLVEALKDRGEIIAMTGDGVNDAPALKIAHVGIAMGQRGTDVAREAASLVLLDDDFGSIVNAISEGRRIYYNLEKTMGYLMAIHVPIAGLALLPLLTQKPAVMMPIHVAMLHLLIEPVCSLVFARMAGPANLMERAPRSPTARLFSKGMVGDVLTYGGVTLLVMGLVYLLALQRGYGEAGTRTLVFATLIGANGGMILRQMGKGLSKSTPSREMLKMAVSWLWLAIGSLVLLGIAVLTPLSKWFLFEKIPPIDLGAALFLGFVINLVLWLLGAYLFPNKPELKTSTHL